MVREICKSMKRFKRKERFFLKIQSVVAFVMVGILMIAMLEARREISTLNNSIKDLYNVTLDTRPGTCVTKDSPGKKVKQLYDWEVSNFDYIVGCKQPLSNLDSKLSKYVRGIDTTLQVNYKFFEHFNLNVSEGRLFNEKDYILKPGTMPIILGDKYKKNIQLHELFRADYVGDKLDLEVVGFLKEGSYYQDLGSLKLFDNCIIMPSIEKVSPEITSNNTKANFLDIYNKCEQNIAAGEGITLDSLKSSFEEESRFLNLVTPYTVMDRYGSCRMWGLEGEKVINLFTMLVTIITIITIVCISINMSVKILSLKKFYAVLIANGVKRRDIYFFIIREILAINIIPLLLLVIIGIFTSAVFTYLGVTLYLIISVLSVIYPCIVFKRLDIAKTLQGDN